MLIAIRHARSWMKSGWARRRRHQLQRVWLLCLLSLLAMGLPGSADPLKAPSQGVRQQGAIVTSAQGGGVRWTAEWALEPLTVNGQREVKITEAGQGRRSPFQQEVQWTVEALWKAESAFSPIRVERRVRDMNGRLLVTERKAFDIARGIVQFERLDAIDGRSTTKELHVPSDTLATEGIGMALSSLPFDSPQPFSAHLLTNAPALYAVTLEPRGRERVKTPAGEFECYKVELVARLGLLDLFQVFVPKTYFWFTVAPPHVWVRYQGLESGLGTPEVIMELARLGRQE